MLVEEEEDLSVSVKRILFCSPGVIINVNAELSPKLHSLIQEPEQNNLFGVFCGGVGGFTKGLKAEISLNSFLIDSV